MQFPKTPNPTWMIIICSSLVVPCHVSCILPFIFRPASFRRGVVTETAARYPTSPISIPLALHDLKFERKDRRKKKKRKGISNRPFVVDMPMVNVQFVILSNRTQSVMLRSQGDLAPRILECQCSADGSARKHYGMAAVSASSRFLSCRPPYRRYDVRK